MDPAYWRRLRRLIEELVELAPEQFDRWVADRPPEERALAEELVHLARRGEFPEPPASPEKGDP